jgi:hypothetical protein
MPRNKHPSLVEGEANLRRWYSVEGLSLAEIADRLALSKTTVRREVNTLGLTRPAVYDPNGSRLGMSISHGHTVLPEDAEPIWDGKALARELAPIGEWPVGIAFEDAVVPREASLGTVGTGYTTGFQSSASLAVED